MTRKCTVPLLVLFALVLAACSPAATPTEIPKQSEGGAQTSAPPGQANAALARSDEQNSVEFVITPLNLNAPGDTLNFDVSLNTHSVDLSWDLAAKSALTTDTGLEVEGLSWPVGGGHHYEGTLTFPAETADGTSLLDGAKTLTVTIRDAGAAERVFVWELLK